MSRARHAWERGLRFALPRHPGHTKLSVRVRLLSIVVVLLASLPAVRASAQPSADTFGGLGIVVTQIDGFVAVVRVMPETVAERAGLRAFDRIVAIEREPTDAMELSEAVDRLRGRPGTAVTLWVSRRLPGGEWAEPRSVRIVRMLLRVSAPDDEAP